jgi:aspartyl-tRNA(Asn)/glutamyl-tRNA(Gln) amidotransferase subunit A
MQQLFPKLSIQELNKLLISKTITPLQLIQTSISIIENNSDLFAITQLLKQEALTQATNLIIDPKSSNLLQGIPFATKDNFATSEGFTTGCTSILQNFQAGYNATVVELLLKQKAINVAKTVLDELAMGGEGGYQNGEIARNPVNRKYIAGGSSGGSAILVAIGAVPFALGSDTGDSVRIPAANCGIIGFKPTYGLISRYGLLPFAPSLDTVGILTRNIADLAIILENVCQSDSKDLTSQKIPVTNFSSQMKLVTGIKVAILSPFFQSLDESIKIIFTDLINKLKLQNIIVEFIDFPSELLKTLVGVYVTISSAEAYSSQSNLTGMTFGDRKMGKNYSDTIQKTRSQNFGYQAKKRYVLGSYTLMNENQQTIL